ncbi:MAG: hypothetical protein JXM70_21435 [Pirellulales bacterium]|nr:hypothetical protein [Pirellulales bacterium]
MPVSVGEWQKQHHENCEIEFLAVQLTSFGFMLSVAEVKELCDKLRQLTTEGTCKSKEGDSLFVDLDSVTRKEPFVILAARPEKRGLAWFCDIPEHSARQLYEKLAQRLDERTVSDSSGDA